MTGAAHTAPDRLGTIRPAVSSFAPTTHSLDQAPTGASATPPHTKGVSGKMVRGTRDSHAGHAWPSYGRRRQKKSQIGWPCGTPEQRNRSPSERTSGGMTVPTDGYDRRWSQHHHGGWWSGDQSQWTYWSLLHDDNALPTIGALTQNLTVATHESPTQLRSDARPNTL